MEYGMSVSRKSLISTLLAGGLLVSLIGATPANAAPTITLSINGVVITTAAVSTTPASVTVPSDNLVDGSDAVRFSLTGVDAGTNIIVSATNSFIISSLSTTLNPVRSTAGETSANFSVTTGSTSEFFAFTKSNQLGTITITNGGVTSTYYLRGTSGPGYTLTYTPNPKPFTSMLSKQTVKIVDIFGNPVVGLAPTVTPINVVSSTPTSTNAEGVSEFTLTYPSTPGRGALAVSIPAVDVFGFPAAVGSISTFIDVLDPNSEIAAVSAALEAEKAARAADKIAVDEAVAAEKAGVTTVAAALEAEKAARAADKSAADAALAAEKAALTAAKDALDAEKAARASEKTARDAEKAAADVVKAADMATAGAALATADAALATEKAARATDKANADSTLAIEKAARATEKAASDAALAAEKAAHATEKAASDAALTAEKAARATDKANADSTLAIEKAARASEKAASDAALAAEKAARTTADAALTAEKASRTAEKAASDKSVESLTARVATLTKQIADLKALYNKLAVKYKQPKIN